MVIFQVQKYFLIKTLILLKDDEELYTTTEAMGHFHSCALMQINTNADKQTNSC